MCEIKYNIRKHSLGVSMATAGTKMGRCSLPPTPKQLAQKVYCPLLTKILFFWGLCKTFCCCPLHSLLSLFWEVVSACRRVLSISVSDRSGLLSDAAAVGSGVQAVAS